MLVKNITSGRLHVELMDGESVSLNAGETIESEKVFALDRLLEIHFLAEVIEEPKVEEPQEPKVEEPQEPKVEEPQEPKVEEPQEPKKVKVSDAVKPPKAVK